MFDVLNVIAQADKLMDIFVVITFIRTKVLLTIRAFYNNMDEQIIRRPFITFICTSDVNC